MSTTVKILLYSLGIGASLGALHYFDLLGAYPSFAWVCFLFFTCQTLFIIAMAGMGERMSSPSGGVSVVLGAMGLKFLFSILMILAYLLAVKPDTMIFIIPFFILYIIYTIIETYHLLQMRTNAVKKS